MTAKGDEAGILPLDGESEEIELNPVQQAFEIWIQPEVERRINSGTWERGTAIIAAQVFLPSPLDGEEPMVRLNGEVQASVKVKFKPKVSIKVGDPVNARDIQEIGPVSRLAQDDANAGLITLLLLENSWHMSFDFRRDVPRASAILDRAQEFTLSASDSHDLGRDGVSYDNLFSAAELAAKAQLLLYMFFPYKHPNDHGAIFGRYRTWSSSGNVPHQHINALKALRRVRPRARYLQGDSPYPEFDELYWTVADMIARTREYAGSVNQEENDDG